MALSYSFRNIGGKLFIRRIISRQAESGVRAGALMLESVIENIRGRAVRPLIQDEETACVASQEI